MRAVHLGGQLDEALLQDGVVRSLLQAQRRLLEVVQQAHSGLVAVKEVVEHRQGAVEVRLLGQVADRDAAPDGDAAAIGRLLAGDDAQQRRLAAAVDANEADAIAFVNEQIDAVQQLALAELLADAFEGDQVHASAC